MKSEKETERSAEAEVRQRNPKTGIKNSKSKIAQPPNADAGNMHLWQITAARDVIFLILIALSFWLLYALSEIFVPLLIALILAHVFNPLVTLLERKWHWPRPLTVSLVLAIVVVACSALVAWLGPLLLAQITDLARRLPDYLRTLASGYNLDISQVEETIRQYQVNPQQIFAQIFKTTGRAVGFVAMLFTVATYMIFSVALVLIYFFFLCWGFNRALHSLEKYLPESRKERIVDILSQMDEAIGQFFRGRLVIAIIMGGLLSMGWYMAGVPFWFFLGMVTGFLNIVPYLSAVTWPIAIVLKYVETLTAGTGHDILSIVLWPSAVYIGVQLLENWVLTPWIQSGQTNLNAATIIIVVFIGAALAGVLGMLLAIPVAACIKILLNEVILPRLRRCAAEN